EVASACGVSFHEPDRCQLTPPNWRGTAYGWLSPAILARTVSSAQHLPCSDHPHTVVVAISNVDVPLRVYVTSMGPVQSGSDRWSVVAGAAPASSSDRRDHASHRVNMTNGMVLGVYDQQIAVVITPNGLGCPPGGCESRTTVTTVATLAS